MEQKTIKAGVEWGLALFYGVPAVQMDGSPEMILGFGIASLSHAASGWLSYYQNNLASWGNNIASASLGVLSIDSFVGNATLEGTLYIALSGLSSHRFVSDKYLSDS